MEGDVVNGVKVRRPLASSLTDTDTPGAHLHTTRTDRRSAPTTELPGTQCRPRFRPRGTGGFSFVSLLLLYFSQPRST